MEGQREREHQLKVDCTAYNLSDTRNKEHFVVVYNINVPATVVNDQESRLNALERICLLLESDFGRNEIVNYQITGTYILRNSESGDTKEWVGSFYAGTHNPAIVADFQLFNSDTFVNTVFPILNNVEEKLLWNGRNTKWTFERLQSVIINAQCTVNKSHPILQIRKLIRRKTKFRNIFNLP
jgi:hypothetical protein